MGGSQLLDLLLDVNDSTKINPSLHYDLRSPTPNVSDVPLLEPDQPAYEAQDVEGARAALMEARHEYEAGEITLADYQEQEAQLSTVINAPARADGPRSLTALSKTTHTTLECVDPSTMNPQGSLDIFDDTPTGFLDPRHEEDMLFMIDAFIATAPPESQRFIHRPPRMTDKEKEKDFQLRNPVSVYNWLQKHGNKVIPHEHEKEARHEDVHPAEAVALKPRPSPKPTSSTGTSSTKPTRKRASSSLVAKQEPEELLLDDEGYVIAGTDEPPPEKKKRKRDDDAYRPKGGSSRARKRAKGSSGNVVKKVEPDVEEGEEDEGAAS
ncbi:hypothetical protein P7C71_g4961, partial [Lecanoromycetidae sp. Uapishka_2]